MPNVEVSVCVYLCIEYPGHEFILCETAAFCMNFVYESGRKVIMLNLCIMDMSLSPTRLLLLYDL